ncbi:MAG: class I SAM-dependent methyltransferase [Sulfitobacter sp.]
MGTDADTDYDKKIKEQIQQYSNNALRFFPAEVHQYWKRHYLAPKLQEVFDTPNHFDIYTNCAPTDNTAFNILSVGSGDGQLEVEMAQRLLASGRDKFKIHATELSPIRQERTKNLVKSKGLEDHFVYHILDFNKKFVEGKFDMIFAHHVLHHIVNLEFLFDSIHEALTPNGVFATMDMIGRNGHMRWPEALEFIDLAWTFIPDHWKHNFQFNAFHENYLNFDCSKSGFEGIRAEDIQPLLVKKFCFSKFVAVGGFMDVLFDRGYGQSIDISNPREAGLVKFLSETNELLLESGRVKPTMVFAQMTRKSPAVKQRKTKVWKNMTPEFALRIPD